MPGWLCCFSRTEDEIGGSGRHNIQPEAEAEACGAHTTSYIYHPPVAADSSGHHVPHHGSMEMTPGLGVGHDFEDHTLSQSRKALDAIRVSPFVTPRERELASTSIRLLTASSTLDNDSNRKQWISLCRYATSRVALMVQGPDADNHRDGRILKILKVIEDDINRLQNQTSIERFRTVLEQSVGISQYYSKLGDEFSPLDVSEASGAGAAKQLELFSSTILPATPLTFIGRTSYTERVATQIRNTLTRDRSASIAILGPPGIGKTTCATAIMQHPMITNLFEQKWFIPCHTTPTISTLVGSIASYLPRGHVRHILSRPNPSSGLIERLDVVGFPKTLLVLDNVESCLENRVANRHAGILDLLQKICDLPNVSVIITMRGSVVPSGVNFDDICVLEPLGLESARVLFNTIAPQVKTDVTSLDNLLGAAECSPLAITLLAKLADQGTSLHALQAQWGSEAPSTQSRTLPFPPPTAPPSYSPVDEEPRRPDILDGLWKQTAREVKPLLSSVNYSNTKVRDWTGLVTRESANPIGCGQFADVFKGRWIGDPKEADPSIPLPNIAIKVFRLARSSEDRRDLEREVLVWQSLQHVNILPFVGVTNEFGDLPALVSLYMDNGTLKSYIEGNPGINKMSLVKGVGSGLGYLHNFKPEITHGDLKPDNILVDCNGNTRLCDFGLSRMKTDTTLWRTKRSDAAGTVRWMAPELLDGSQVIPSQESDVWAFAMTTWEILTGRLPYSQYTREVAVIVAVVVRDERPHQGFTSAPLWSLLETCWEKIPSQRPNMDTVNQSLLVIPDTSYIVE